MWFVRVSCPQRITQGGNEMKKILCLLLAAAMVLSLAGCGKSEAARLWTT